MIDQRSKPSLRTLTQKREISDENAKYKHSSKYVSHSSKTKMEGPSNRKTSAGSSPRNTTAKNYDEQVKMKLMDLTPRNKAKETSEGVQEFIKHVSDIIEKKNPFKESEVCSWPKGIRKNANSPVIDSIQFNGVSKTNQEYQPQEDLESEKSCAVDVNEISRKLIRRLKYRGKLNLVPPVKKDSDNAKKINRPKSSMKKKDQRDKKSEKESSPLPEGRVESKPTKNATAGKEVQEVTDFKKPPGTREGVAEHSQNQNKRRRPSEIPLRKTRTDSTKKPKPLSLSLSLGKPLKEVERTTSVDLHLGRSFSPMRAVDGCPELQMTINVDLSSEEISIIGEEIEPQWGTCPINEEISSTLKVHSDSSSTFNFLTKPSMEFPEENFSPGKKTNVIDLGKVKTSSFTVLRNNSTVLNRLETLHKKNVLSKEKSANGNSTSQMALTSKLSFGSLNRKSLRKTSLCRLSSKGNKLGLKTNVKSTKKEAKKPENLRRGPKSKVELQRNNCVDLSGKDENSEAGSRKMNLKKRRGREDSQPERVLSARERSTSCKGTTRIEAKEEVETPSKKRVVLDSQTESPPDSKKSERPISVRNSLFSKLINEQNIMLSNSTEKKLGRALDFDDVIGVPMTPPPTPNNTNEFELRQTEGEEDRWSTKTVTFDEKFNNENYQCGIESEITSETVPEKTEANSKGSSETARLKQLSLVVKGTPLNVGKDEPPEKPEELELPALKKQLKIDLRTLEATGEEFQSGLVVYVSNEEKYKEMPIPVRDGSNDAGNGRIKEGTSNSKKEYSDLFTLELTNEPGSLNASLKKSLSSLKRKSHSKSGGGVKGARKKKLRSDAGDRPSSSASVLFNADMPHQNKNKLDTKARSGLTKSSKREEMSDVFEEVGMVKLRRRSSEPNSFRGYVWKCVDAATPKAQKASMSSLTSSLRHLNTDDIDDFIFWEAVPQRMTSCWEMSLYHFKRPWSVLSCSVFRDNRKSSTPGLILENLRNGGTFSTRRFAVNQSERVACRDENLFDIEPSIAQKNIDIRNWLAALNFPTLSSTSNDVLPEGNYNTETAVDKQNLNKPQMGQKRRKTLSNFKFSDEADKKCSQENKHRKSSKWCDEEDLTDLVRRKSGGFVTSEQFLNSQQSTQRPNVTVNFCVYSKSAEESILVETFDKNTFCEPRKYKSVEIAAQPELSISATIINSGAVVGDQLIERSKTKEKTPLEMPVPAEGNSLTKHSKGEVAIFRSDINVWKYLFLMTIFIIVVHYCYMNRFMYSM